MGGHQETPTSVTMEEKIERQMKSREAQTQGRVTTYVVHKHLGVLGKTLSLERSRAKKKGNLKERTVQESHSVLAR